MRPLPEAADRLGDGQLPRAVPVPARQARQARPAGAPGRERRAGRRRVLPRRRPTQPGARPAGRGGARAADVTAVPAGLPGAVRRVRRAAGRRGPGPRARRRHGPALGGPEAARRPNANARRPKDSARRRHRPTGGLTWRFPSGGCPAATPDRGARTGRPPRRLWSAARSATSPSCRTWPARPAARTVAVRSSTRPERGAVGVVSRAWDAGNAGRDPAELRHALGVPIMPKSLERALTHRSFAYENANPPTNERLEFLGDSVLGLVVTDTLFRGYPAMPEGQLAKLRAAVVQMRALADVARELSLGAYVKLGRGEQVTGGRDKPSILADTLEAVIGAVYIDCGLAEASALVHRLFDPVIDRSAALGAGLDWKTSLQELTAGELLGGPGDQVEESGPDHQKSFRAVVRVGGRVLGSGQGRTKKEAEQQAAEAAWNAINAASGPADGPVDGTADGAPDGPAPGPAEDS